KHTKLLADTGDLGREPVYQELRRSVQPTPASTPTPPSGWKRLRDQAGASQAAVDQVRAVLDPLEPALDGAGDLAESAAARLPMSRLTNDQMLSLILWSGHPDNGS
ncbi:hypothetical protein ABZY81_44275, partial [Streptomyces sp. NPDC006514]|uniref:hypothetical protein n=1 Tax=Streptomyces sp. NPDC006514 TaxID=3154308 RepID=UPI0033B6C471